MKQVDVLIIGAGAAGMMCAIEAGKRGRSVLVVDHAAAPGEKIRISGGGRCNFTNLNAAPPNFISKNRIFAFRPCAATPSATLSVSLIAMALPGMKRRSANFFAMAQPGRSSICWSRK